MQEIKSRSVLTLEQGARFSLTAVEKVISFSDQEIQLIAGGQRVRLAGSNLKILSFSEGSGNFMASGAVSSVKYGAGKPLQKLFR